ncbi:NAD(P)H-hydrate dehydratase [Candidatus Gottesmanbacteria bacterium]|nr:NAD(P)H-hydrate dehydratase [Candidatus Gottesmanbacteria bacterium]
MKTLSFEGIRSLMLPKTGSHKGQNGRLLIIGGSHLFHAASIWALEVASRVVDLVHYSSVPENNEIVMSVKKQFRNGIIIPREEIDAYITEDDCILIGPGMVRDDETKILTHSLLTRYPDKQWVIDAGALQMMELSDIPRNAILTPHHQEFAGLWKKMVQAGSPYAEAESDEDKVRAFAKTYHCVVLLKGMTDIVCSGGDCDGGVCVPGEVVRINGGNEGMTKGGTGDVLAGLIAALSCYNDPVLAVLAGSFINKQAGDALYKTVGPFYNASDLAAQIPKIMRRLFIYT